jgi:ribosome-associated translation inhibitor RaiA
MTQVEKIKGTVVSNGESIKALAEVLKDWKPANKIDTVKMLCFLSVVDKSAKELKEKSYNYLQNICKDCENAIDPDSGLEVVRTERNTKFYNTSDEIEKLEEQLEKIQAKIKAAKEKAGISHTIPTVYYRAKI